MITMTIKNGIGSYNHPVVCTIYIQNNTITTSFDEWFPQLGAELAKILTSTYHKKINDAIENGSESIEINLSTQNKHHLLSLMGTDLNDK